MIRINKTQVYFKQQQMQQEREKLKWEIRLLEAKNKRLDMVNKAIAKETDIKGFINLLRSY